MIETYWFYCGDMSLMFLTRLTAILNTSGIDAQIAILDGIPFLRVDIEGAKAWKK